MPTNKDIQTKRIFERKDSFDVEFPEFFERRGRQDLLNCNSVEKETFKIDQDLSLSIYHLYEEVRGG